MAGSNGTETHNGETHPLPHDPPRDGDKRWHYKGNVWTTFCANPGHNRFTNHSSKACPLSKGIERESIKMTSSTQPQGNVNSTSTSMACNYMTVPCNEPTTKNDGESIMPALPSPEVRKKLPTITMLLND